MNIHLQQSTFPNLYVAKKGDWTANIDFAKSFNSGEKAVSHVQRHLLSAMSLFVCFESASFNFTVRIPEVEHMRYYRSRCSHVA